MKIAFDTASNLVVVIARIDGPKGPTPFQLALDTGASSTVVSADLMSLIGYDLKKGIGRAHMTSASGTAKAVRVVATKIEALGHVRCSFPIVCHNFPETSTVDGVLGLDFFRGMELTIDFRAGTIELK